MCLTLTWLSVIILFPLAALFLKTFVLSFVQFWGILTSPRTLNALKISFGLALPAAIANPVMFLAADRELAEEAWAGDIIGIPNHGQLRIGDALTKVEDLRFTGIPSFAPELLQGVRAGGVIEAREGRGDSE